MARSIGSATVSFGLVAIPIKLYTATDSKGSISFNLLHKKDGSRLKQQYVCIKENTVVERDDMVKGYEFAKDRYVVFTPEELKELEEKASQTIEITEFVPVAQVDPVYYDKVYYLGPDKGGDKPYMLLAKAMHESGRVAIGKYAARGKQFIVMVRPTADDRLVMQQLHYADEVRSAADIDVGKVEVKDQELKLALQLIDQIAVESFDPTRYEDEVRDRIKEHIDRKVAGEEIQVADSERPQAQIIDLMDALKASLGKKAPAAPVAKRARRTQTAAAKSKKTAKG
ncbi:MAG: Ku protein [Blastocatellia bacterium]|jgi:DNA end-binding protein Ku|nr:Ku protein [Blastocatellia bacterium]MBK6426839.1 Ku protein [Blastocatellia bacterium]